MKYKHIKNKGFYVGTFNETQLNEEKLAVEQAKNDTGCKYVNTELVKKNGTIVGLKIYVCTADELKI